MKVFLDDAQSAIVIATLHDQQQFLSCLLLNSQLNNTVDIDSVPAYGGIHFFVVPQSASAGKTINECGRLSVEAGFGILFFQESVCTFVYTEDDNKVVFLQNVVDYCFVLPFLMVVIKQKFGLFLFKQI